MAKVLVIDDEEYMGWVIKKAFAATNINVISVLTGSDGIKTVEDQNIDVVILDLRLKDMDGMEVLEKIKNVQSDIPIIIITAHGSIDTAIESMKKGAYHYITKPFDVDELMIQVQNALEVGRLKDEVKSLRGLTHSEKGTGILTSKNEEMQQIYKMVEQIADTDATILITGESGTGKELIARSIHQFSYRSGKSFIAINCAALPENLLESELFGYEKGAFTGAVNRRLGRFELAHQGTIFLDEIGEMSQNMQAKLLRVLQDKEFERVGGNNSVKVDVRIIAATNRNLLKCIEEGTFREDLYYRLNVVGIELPPLRQRQEDIPELVGHFIKKFDVRSKIKGISQDTLDLLIKYRWPGNVRELENVMERAVILNQDELLRPTCLPKEILQDREKEVDNIIYFPKEGIHLEKVEKDLIVKALNLSSGNQTRAAELLGITRSALIYRMQKYDIK